VFHRHIHDQNLKFWSTFKLYQNATVVLIIFLLASGQLYP
jgi:hypothetical protein